MGEKMKQVADLIRKTFKSDGEKNCFDGCILYINEHCVGMRDICVKEMDLKFQTIDKKLDMIIQIVGVNGNGKS